jgi:succinoglycan biosynthesis protein ExoM
MKISICIATCERPEQLRAILADIVAQRTVPFEVVVVDNDAGASARSVIEERRRLGMPCDLIYDIQPKRNISLTRNRTVELANGDWLAFLDDDERVPRNWLTEMVATFDIHAADGVLGPVIPVLPSHAPIWIRRGHFYDWPRMKTGRVVPRNRLRFGNVVLRAGLLKRMPIPFDPNYGLTGGEDGDLLSRLTNGGARILWCDEACVNEPITQARLSFAWLAKRSLRGGQDFARHFIAGRYGVPAVGARAAFALRALAQGALAACLAPVTIVLGRHASAYWLLKAIANAGKLSVFGGWHYREYAAAPTLQQDVVA